MNLNPIRDLLSQGYFQKAERLLRPFLAKNPQESEALALHQKIRLELARLCDFQIEGFAYLGSYSYSAHGLTFTVSEYEHLLTVCDFVLLPPKEVPLPLTFFRGSPPQEEGRCSNETRHLVRLTQPFLVAKTPVTQKTWYQIQRTTPSYHPLGALYPVELISWDDCQFFCKKTGLQLLSEAQWEYAARGGTTSAFFCGEELRLEWANFSSSKPIKGVTQTSPVGHYPPNAFGLFDMNGNVNEWCQDWYQEDYEKDKTNDPLGPKRGLNRIYRGGSAYDPPYKLRSAMRSSMDPLYQNCALGLRVGKTLPLPPP
jgi:sulfatase modifying factor 1